jgi:hypothetical protein
MAREGIVLRGTRFHADPSVKRGKGKGKSSNANVSGANLAPLGVPSTSSAEALNIEAKRMRISIRCIKEDVAEVSRLYSKYVLRVRFHLILFPDEPNRKITFQIEGSSIPPSTGVEEDTASLAFTLIARKWGLELESSDLGQVRCTDSEPIHRDLMCLTTRFSLLVAFLPPRQARYCNGLQHDREGISL